jgi:hypothetical protein
MPEKKRNYDADTLSILNLNLSKNQGSNAVTPRSGNSKKGSSGKVSSENSKFSHDLIQRLINKMKDA